ncbi:alpha/beta-hydrolase [Rhizodiscina lignyota]|uniref:Alpha/beta-hydrolase n=1 Tax=Rhizodiscina lignyota TaxID=1504668 RepID=A0A9P4MB92_9PEZI|nr:alpha/beta-hydrolase [Rhizodiscina lignyota]
MATTLSKPVLVFIPGAWHTPKCFKEVINILVAQGFECDAVSLPSVGAEARGEEPVKNWDPDVEAIRSTITSYLNLGKDVVPIAHSYGGTCASQAVMGLSPKDRAKEGKEGSVRRMIYISALLLKVGGYIWESSGGKPWGGVVRLEGGEQDGVIYPTESRNWFYGDLSDEEAAEAAKDLQSEACGVYLSRATYEPWFDIPCTYIRCTRDKCVLPEFQEYMLQTAGGHMDAVMFDSDHSPFLSRPKLMADMIQAQVMKG